MTSLAGIMDGIAAQLTAALADPDDPVVEGLQVVPRLNPNPTPPSIDVYPGDPFAQAIAFGTEVGEVVFTIRARVTTADNVAGQDALLALMDPGEDTSVAVALVADQTLGGLVDSLKVEGPSGYTSYGDSGGQGALLGCEWRVTVLP